jgi:polar amino acid transport system substrate-binding protein
MPAIVLLFCLLLLSGATQAASNCSHAYRVGISQIGYSYYLLDDGTPAGSSFDFYQELGQRSGCTFQLRPLPRMRAWHEADLQHLDIVSPTIRTAERDRQGVFVEYFKNRNDILIDRRHTAGIDSLAQLLADPSIKIGLIRGHSSGPYFDQRLAPLYAQQRIQLSPTAHNLFLKLQAGRIQAVVRTGDRQPSSPTRRRIRTTRTIGLAGGASPRSRNTPRSLRTLKCPSSQPPAQAPQHRGPTSHSVRSPRA